MFTLAASLIILAAPAQSEKPERVAASALFEAYHENTAKADEKWLRKSVEVTGIVRAMFPSEDKKAFLVVFRVGDAADAAGGLGLHCEFDPANPPKVKVGDRATISGTCMGSPHVRKVVISKCKLVKAE